MNDQYRRRLTTARKTTTPIRLALAVTLALAGWGSAALATNDPIPGVPDYGQSVTSTASVSAGAPSANGIAGGPIPGPSQPAGVVFTSENWNAPQTGRTPPASADGAGKPSGIVAVTVVDDPSAVGDRAALPPKGGDNKTPPGIAPRKAGGHDPTQEYSSAPIPNNENVKAAIVRNPEPFNNPKNDSANSDGSLNIFDRWGNLLTDTSVEPAGPPSTISTSRSNIKRPTKVDAGVSPSVELAGPPSTVGADGIAGGKVTRGRDETATPGINSTTLSGVDKSSRAVTPGGDETVTPGTNIPVRDSTTTKQEKDDYRAASPAGGGGGAGKSANQEGGLDLSGKTLTIDLPKSGEKQDEHPGLAGQPIPGVDDHPALSSKGGKGGGIADQGDDGELGTSQGAGIGIPAVPIGPDGEPGLTVRKAGSGPEIDDEPAGLTVRKAGKPPADWIAAPTPKTGDETAKPGIFDRWGKKPPEKGKDVQTVKEGSNPAGFGTGMNGSPGVGPAMDGMGGMNPMMGPGGRANPMIGPGGAAGPGNPMMGGGAMGGRP